MKDHVYVDTIEPQVEGLAHAIVHHTFVSMLNPKYRGPAWRWENFPDFCARHAAATCWSSFSSDDWARWKEDIQQDIAARAAGYAQECLDTSGILDWWPKEGG